MTKKKKAVKTETVMLNLRVEGVSEFGEALSIVTDWFNKFTEDAKGLQHAVDRLNAIEVKVTVDPI